MADYSLFAMRGDYEASCGDLGGDTKIQMNAGIAMVTVTADKCSKKTD